MKPRNPGISLPFFTRICLMAAGCVLTLTQSAIAADGTWTGGAGDPWDTNATNWSGVAGTPWDAANGPTNLAIFNTAGATASVSGTVFTNGITFSNTATLSSGIITLSGPTVTTTADAIVSSVIAGSVGLTKAGTGSLKLTGDNAFTGNVTNTVAGGITITHSNALGSGTKTIVMNTASVATLRLDGSAGNLSIPAETGLQTAGTQAGGSIINVAGNNTINGNVTLNSGTGGTAFSSDSGNLTLAGTVKITGGTVRTLFLRGVSNGEITGVISNGGASLPITKDTGNGTWTLSGANTYTGATIVSAGTLKAGVASTTAPDSGAFGVNSSVTVNALGTLDITGFNTRINALIGTGLVNLGAANLTIGTANASSTYDGTISGTGGSLTKVGTGAQRLGGSNDFSGGTTVTNGDIITTNAAALGSGALTLANTTNQIDCFGLEGGVDLSKAITINLSAQRAGISALTSGDNTLSGPITISGSGPNNTVVIANNVNASTMTLSNTITSSTAGGVLSFRGSGVGSTGLATNTITLPSDANLDLNGTTNWTFSGSGSTWGTTGIYGGGNIVLGANNALSVTAVTGIGGGAGVVDLAGFNQTVGGLSGPVTRIIGNSSTATDSVITIAAASPQSFAGAVADTVGSGTRKVSLVLNGGSQTLTGASTYTGATTLNAGTLTVTGSLGATAVEVKNTGVLAGIGAIGGSVTVRPGGHQQFAVAATAGSQPLRTITGLLTLEANTVIDLTAAVPPAPGGPYILLTATGGISGSVGSVTFSGVSGSVVKNGSNLELTVTASSGYASWIDTLAFGLAPADKDPTDDPDNDGMDNLLEFVLNGNPSISDNSILPKLVVTATDFEFTYQRRDDSVSPETTETFQWGTTLASWPGSAVIPAASALVGAATITVSPGTPNNAVTDTVKISIPKTEAGVTGKLFGRLQVVKP